MQPPFHLGVAVAAAVILAGCAGTADMGGTATGELDAVTRTVAVPDRSTAGDGAGDDAIIAGTSDGQAARARPDLDADDLATALSVHDAFEQLTAALERQFADQYAGGTLAASAEDPATIRFVGPPSEDAMAIVGEAPIEVVVDTTATHTLTQLRTVAADAAAAIEGATGASVIATVVEATGTIDLDVGDAVVAEVVAALPVALDEHTVALHVAGDPVQLDG